jgi:hypothetical protein
MAKNAALLAAHGIGAPRQAQVNAALTQPIGSRIPSLRAGFKKLVAEGGYGGQQTLVVSDENLLGFLNSIFAHGAFYPDTARRLARLKQMLPVDPEKIVVAIRAYDSFFASAYGRWLKPERMVLERKALATVVLGLARGWADVLADIADTFPHAELSISEYSPDPGFGPSQLKAILGPLADALVFNADYRWNRSMSARQTMLYERAILAGDSAQADEIRTWKRFKQPPLVEGFWDKATQTALQARYSADKAAILERFPAFVTNDRFAGQDAG